METATDIDDAKHALRREAAAHRRDAAAADDGGAGDRLAAHFLEAVTVPDGAPVSGYWPIRTEIDVMPLLRALAARGHPVALPVVAGAGRPLVFRSWREGDAMEKGPYGISEPLATAPLLVPQILLVPLLAFDRAGYRLGYGGGFYDRNLATLRKAGPAVAVGAAWAAQEVAAVPRDASDQKLDWVVTEREALRVSGDGG
jgi:5-formyltetrahydrofolate cyclo-ligase